ncbi:hypothetical protein PCASD_09494, partial [Puccinia coronata f. sp. avenae]
MSQSAKPTTATASQADHELFALLDTLIPLPLQTQPVGARPHKRQRLENTPSSVPPPFPGSGSLSVAVDANDEPPDHPQNDVSSSSSSKLPQSSLTPALSMLEKLVANPRFLDKIQQMKDSQDQFELRAIDQRNQIKAEIDRALKKIASDPSTKNTNEAKVEKMKAEHEAKLRACDQSILSRWDQLRQQQKLTLQN